MFELQLTSLRMDGFKEEWSWSTQSILNLFVPKPIVSRFFFLIEKVQTMQPIDHLPECVVFVYHSYFYS